MKYLYCVDKVNRKNILDMCRFADLVIEVVTGGREITDLKAVRDQVVKADSQRKLEDSTITIKQFVYNWNKISSKIYNHSFVQRIL